MNANTAKVTYLLVKKLGVPLTAKTISEDLLVHPTPNSMLAISEVLEQWRVPNAAYKNIDFNSLTKVPLPFIAYLNSKEFVLVTSLDRKQATFSNDKWSNRCVKLSDFEKSYTGTILIAEKDEFSGDPSFRTKWLEERLTKLRIPVILTVSLLILLSFVQFHSFYTTSFNITILLLTLSKTAGLITTIFLLMHSIDATNPMIERLCSKDKNKSCNAILSSKAAKITGWLGWSDIGFIYFAGTFFILIFKSSNLHLVQLLAVFDLLALPYTFYSIYYQSVIAKQWCPLCCSVQVILWFEFFTFLIYVPFDIPFLTLNEVVDVIIAFSLPAIGWLFIKPNLLQQKELQLLKGQLHRFKYNTDLFNKLLDEQDALPLLSESESLMIGNPNADHLITMVANTYCQPCGKVHKKIDEWLAGRQDIKLQMIFLTYDSETDRRAKVAAHLLSLAANNENIFVKKAINDWYQQKQKSFEAWAKIYPVNEDINTGFLLNKQREWCEKVGITSTPTIFINGRRLPKNYRVEDIKYFI